MLTVVKSWKNDILKELKKEGMADGCEYKETTINSENPIFE